VDCENEASARADFEKISKKCGWSSDSVKDQLASSEWQSPLILDNCDDVKTDYNHYIPNGSQVSVVLTTRLSDARKYASADPRDMERKKLFLRLDGLDAESAVDLVLEASDVEERNLEVINQATQIVTALDFHPLALNAASSLIRSAVYSLEEYADALEDRLAQKELLDTEFEQARYLKVSATFEVSADSLQRLASTDPTAKAALALLDILGFMHHQNISEDIFMRAWEVEEAVLYWYGGENDDTEVWHLSSWHVMQSRSVFHYLPLKDRIRLFRKARALLVQLSLASIVPHENCMSLHLVVHRWARERVSRPAETWTAVASMLALSAQEPKDWQPFTNQLVCHQETIFASWQELSVSGTASDQWKYCKILYAYGWQMLLVRSSRALDTCLQLDSQMQGLVCGNDSAVLAKSLLGMAHRLNHQAPEAMEIFDHVARLRAKNLREDHPDRLDSQHQLAGVYFEDGQHTKAIEILERMQKLRGDMVWEDNSQRLLAHAYLRDGQTTRSIEILERIVKVDEEQLPEDHPLRLTSQAGLACAYNEDGRNKRAIRLLQHVVKAQEKWPADHKLCLASQWYLARAYIDDGQITEAIELLQHAVKVEEKLPADCWNRLVSQHNLACAYLDNGQVTEAIEVLQHVVKAEKKLPANCSKLTSDRLTSDRLESQYVLASAYWYNNQAQEALELLGRVVRIQQQTLHADDHKRIASERLLALIKKEEENSDDEEANEDDDEDLSSNQGTAGSDRGSFLARIENEDDDYDEDGQYEGDDEDENDIEHEVDSDHEIEDANEAEDEDLSSNQDSTSSETSTSVASIKVFRQRRIKLALRSRPRRRGD
jgi:tetratricopeptide (TPR) repeat protein